MSGIGVGIDLGGTKMLLACFRAGKPIETRVLPTGAVFTPHDAEDAMHRFILDLGVEPAGVGIAVPGLVGHDGVVAASDVLPHFAGWNPAKKLDVARVHVLNDANAALVEISHGLEPGATAAVVMNGTGIGAAFLVAGKMLRGNDGWAGELGSIPIVAGDRTMTLDEAASGGSLVRRLGLLVDEAIARAEKGEPEVLEHIATAGRHFGLGLATVINLFNPGVLVVAGGALRWPGYWEQTLTYAERGSMAELWAKCELRRWASDVSLPAYGAARVALQPAYQPEIPAPVKKQKRETRHR